VPDAAAFDAHLAAVVAFHGRGLTAFDGVFLGAASATSLGDPLLLDRLARVHGALGSRRRGVAAFGDPDRSPPRDARAWERLREAGLRDVTVGLETGLPALRASVGKRADLEAFVTAVRSMREGGLRVAVTVLAGLGGAEGAAEHERATADAIGSMGLSAADLVYLSPLEGSMPAPALAAATEALRTAIGARTEARLAPYAAAGFVPRA
jgi:radical SAM superfamily enzyme YgiQ (UPF0313 family)